MSWDELVTAIRAESPPDVAAKIEQRILHDLAGLRISVPTKARPSDSDIREALRANGFNVEKAAKALGVHARTVYRRLQPERNKQTKPRNVGPMMSGRIVR